MPRGCQERQSGALEDDCILFDGLVCKFPVNCRTHPHLGFRMEPVGSQWRSGVLYCILHGLIKKYTGLIIEICSEDVHVMSRPYLDSQGIRHAGCPLLAREIGRIRPRLVVFGHIHVSYGREDVYLDKIRRTYDEIMSNSTGWMALA